MWRRRVSVRRKIRCSGVWRNVDDIEPQVPDLERIAVTYASPCHWPQTHTASRVPLGRERDARRCVPPVRGSRQVVRECVSVTCVMRSPRSRRRRRTGRRRGPRRSPAAPPLTRRGSSPVPAPRDRIVSGTQVLRLSVWRHSPLWEKGAQTMSREVGPQRIDRPVETVLGARWCRIRIHRAATRLYLPAMTDAIATEALRKVYPTPVSRRRGTPSGRAGGAPHTPSAASPRVERRRRARHARLRVRGEFFGLLA
jgi:hypothetical protein